MNQEKITQAFQLFDEANQADPNIEQRNGKDWPKELLYAHRMTECLVAYVPNASEALQLAARSQHICRWEIPRKSYPMDKKGYHTWRNELKKFHAEKAASILTKVGYDEAMIEKVKDLLTKKKLRRDPDMQVLEDVICLVFLQYYLDDFSDHYNEEKLISILQKTWKKMSEKGHQAALEISFSDKVKPLVLKAVAE